MKLHILGASGSGVTTLGNTLRSQLGIPYFDSDEYFWIKTEPPFIQRRIPEERNNLIINDLKVDNWILGGSVINWGKNIFPKFDLIVFLYIPQGLRIERLKNREYKRYGDLIYTNPDRARQFNNFILWASDYDENSGIANRTLKAHRNWLKGQSSPVLELVGDFSTQGRINQIIEKLKEEKLLPTTAKKQ